MCQTFGRICTTFRNCNNAENMRLVAQTLLRSILSETHRLPESELQSLERDLGSIVGRIGAEQGPIAILLFQRFSKKTTENGIGEDALFGSPPSPTLAAKLFSIGSYERKNGDCSYFLGLLHGDGYQNNHRQPVKALQLFKKAIDEGGRADALNNLGILLDEGAEGVSPEPVQAVELYSRAINVFAMSNLAFLLTEGSEGEPADPAKAVELYRRGTALKCC